MDESMVQYFFSSLRGPLIGRFHSEGASAMILLPSLQIISQKSQHHIGPLCSPQTFRTIPRPQLVYVLRSKKRPLCRIPGQCQENPCRAEPEDTPLLLIISHYNIIAWASLARAANQENQEKSFKKIFDFIE